MGSPDQLPAPHHSATGAIELDTPDQSTVTLRAHDDAPDPAELATALDEAISHEPATVVVDLTEVRHFSMEAVWALISKAASASAPRLIVRPSRAVASKVARLGLNGVLPLHYQHGW